MSQRERTVVAPLFQMHHLTPLIDCAFARRPALSASAAVAVCGELSTFLQQPLVDQISLGAFLITYARDSATHLSPAAAAARGTRAHSALCLFLVSLIKKSCEFKFCV